MQVYEAVLAAALASQGCGARSLALGGPWRWLLKEVCTALVSCAWRLTRISEDQIV